MDQFQSLGFNVDLSDKMQIVDLEEKKPLVYPMSLNTDIYETISFFLGKKSGDDPFYIVDLGEVFRKYSQFVRNLPRVQPFYAIKSNPDPMIIDSLAKLGCGFDCASKDEIILAISALTSALTPNITQSGTQAELTQEQINDQIVAQISENVIYANPTKDCGSLQFARAQDIDYLTFDSACELEKIRLFHTDAKCVIRIKVDDSGSECRFSTKFGCGVDDVKGLLEKAKMDEINVVGVSFHVGSGCKVIGQFEKAIRDTRLVFDIAKELGFNMNLVDIGGGFPGFDDQTENSVTFEMLADEINQAIDKYFGNMENIRYIAEPGRFMCASSHTLVTTVIGIKTAIDEKTKEKEFKYTINEGIYGSFNCIIFDHAKPQILPFNERTEKNYYKSVIFGSTCDSCDKISSGILLPKLTIGDRLFVQNFGAYTRASSSSFNGFSTSLIHYIIKM